MRQGAGDDTPRGRGRWLAWVLGAVAVLAVPPMIAVNASTPSVNASYTRTAGLADGDAVTVGLSGLEGRDDVFLTQCVQAEALPDGERCGRSAGATPAGDGTALLALTVRSQVGGHPLASCPPPEGGRCVLRVTQGGTTRSSRGISAVSGAPPDTDERPPDGTKVVQDITLSVIDPNLSTPTPPTTTPGSPSQPPPQVGGVQTPRPALPTAPVDGPRGANPATSPGGTEVAGAAADRQPRESMPVTGPSRTLVLAILGFVLLELGWVAASATRRASPVGAHSQRPR